MARRTANPGQNPVATVPGKNGGRLRVGGTNPNAGRPPSELRARLRGSLAERVHIAEQIADDPKASSGDRIRALDFLGKYGLGTTITETDTQGRDLNVRVIRDSAARRAVTDN